MKGIIIYDYKKHKNNQFNLILEQENNILNIKCKLTLCKIWTEKQYDIFNISILTYG